MKEAADRARIEGVKALSPSEREGFVRRYDQFLAAGLAANPPPVRRSHQHGRLKQSPARNLLERLWLGRDEVLAFLDDLATPFDNNQAERDLRLSLLFEQTKGEATTCVRDPLSRPATLSQPWLNGYLRGGVNDLSSVRATQMVVVRDTMRDTLQERFSTYTPLRLRSIGGRKSSARTGMGERHTRLVSTRIPKRRNAVVRAVATDSA
jgi:Transposase IS66 family